MIKCGCDAFLIALSVFIAEAWPALQVQETMRRAPERTDVLSEQLCLQIPGQHTAYTQEPRLATRLRLRSSLLQ